MTDTQTTPNQGEQEAQSGDATQGRADAIEELQESLAKVTAERDIAVGGAKELADERDALLRENDQLRRKANAAKVSKDTPARMSYRSRLPSLNVGGVLFVNHRATVEGRERVAAMEDHGGYGRSFWREGDTSAAA